MHEIQKLLKYYKSDIIKVICKHVLGPPNPGFRSVIIERKKILKKDSQYFRKKFNLGSYEYLASLESNIRRCPFF